MRIGKRLTVILLAFVLFAAGLPLTDAAESALRYGAEIHYTAAQPAGTDFTNFGSLLRGASKVIYDNLVKNIDVTRDGKSEVVFYFPDGTRQNDLNETAFQNAINAFNRDHSEVFWIDFSSTILIVTDMGGGSLQAKFKPLNKSYYTASYSSQKDVDRDIELQRTRIEELRAAALAQKTVYDQILYLHDWLVFSNSYNTMPDAELPMRSFEAVSALEGNTVGEKRPVCEGYARAFQLLCSALNIPCALVTGEGVSNGITGQHIWNYVLLDGAWYAVDVTWDDALNLDAQGKIGHTFFLVGSETLCSEKMTFAQSHHEGKKLSDKGSDITYPKISSDAYSVNRRKLSDGMRRFTTSASYAPELFADVVSGAWYESGVASAYGYGLMKGTGDGRFGVGGTVSLAEAITMAVRIHAIYHGKPEPVSSKGKWYDAYVSYALAEGIIKSEYKNYSAAATRSEFAKIFAGTLPESELGAVNQVKDGSIPDIPAKAPYSGAAYLLYRAGVLIGNDQGAFQPNASITRAEVALIVTRMIAPGERVRIS